MNKEIECLKEFIIKTLSEEITEEGIYDHYDIDYLHDECLFIVISNMTIEESDYLYNLMVSCINQHGEQIIKKLHEISDDWR